MSSPQPQQNPSSSTLSNSLLAKASTSATAIFRNHVRAVLHQSSSSCLRRLLSQRVRDHYLKLPYVDSASTSKWDDPYPIQVTDQDISISYELASRVGNRWAEVLQREGYHELSAVVLRLVKEGRYLEHLSKSEKDIADDVYGIDSDDDGNDEYLTPYAKLLSLRRYGPDCDGSGEPAEFLPVQDWQLNQSTSGLSTPDRPSSAMKVIRKIDKIAERGETMWCHGWDVICAAVEQNKKRLYIQRRGNEIEDNEDEYEVIPKMSELLVDEGNEIDCEKDEDGPKIDAATGEASLVSLKRKEKRQDGSQQKSSFNLQNVSYEGEAIKITAADKGDSEMKDSDFILSTNSWAAARLKKRKREQEESDSKNLKDAKNTRIINPELAPRAPSTIGDQRFTWAEVLQCMDMDERRKLIESMIHPPCPHVDGDTENNDDIDTKGYTIDTKINEAKNESENRRENDGQNETKIGDDMLAETGKDPPEKSQKIKPNSAKARDVRECKVNSEENQQVNMNVTGALKKIGSIHLWEQTRNIPNDGLDQSENADETHRSIDSTEFSKHERLHGAAEAQANIEEQQMTKKKNRALRRAASERTYPRVPVSSFQKAEYSGLGKYSKVIWTEEGERRNYSENSRPGLFGDEENQPVWMELDLGECSVELIEENDKEKKKSRKVLAFRSLEISLIG